MGPTFSDLKNKTAVVTGGYGVIGNAIAHALALNGVRVAIVGRDQTKAQNAAQVLFDETGVHCIGTTADVCRRPTLEQAAEIIAKELGDIDILVNCAGGNRPDATTKIEQMSGENSPDLSQTFFGLDPQAIEEVFNLNYMGTLLPTMVFGQDMVRRKSGAILNISSMNSFRPLTKIPAYSGAKAAINNLTQWLAVHFAPTGVRVNAIAPGFFLTDQNKFLLQDEKTGNVTPRGEKIIAHTPMGRFGNAQELTAASLFLLSNAASFVTGVVLPVDGGFSAYSGV